jgi:hypothetical protein
MPSQEDVPAPLRGSVVEVRSTRPGASPSPVSPRLSFKGLGTLSLLVKKNVVLEGFDDYEEVSINRTTPHPPKKRADDSLR